MDDFAAPKGARESKNAGWTRTTEIWTTLENRTHLRLDEEFPPDMLPVGIQVHQLCWVRQTGCNRDFSQELFLRWLLVLRTLSLSPTTQPVFTSLK